MEKYNEKLYRKHLQQYRNNKEKFENLIKNQEFTPDSFLDLIQSCIDVRALKVNGEVITIEDDITVTWIKYKVFDAENYSESIFADAYFTIAQLDNFASDPFRYMAQDTQPCNIYLFALFEDFITEIAPYVIKLHHQGAPSITCFIWNGDEYSPIDAVKTIYNLISVITEPSLYKDFKKSIRDNNNGLYDIHDLAYLKNLKNLAHAI